ncbi:MAG: glycoside hydrolase family 16 protein [Tenacibaculum sp.]
MKNIFKRIGGLSILLFLIIKFILVQCKYTQSQSKQRKLIWQDEFNYSGLPDSSKWGYEKGFVRNNEPQYYTAKRTKNARVENGYLVIEAHKEFYSKGKEKANYTSASITTFNKAHFKYGTIEFKAKFDAVKGLWPAFWMLGVARSKVTWPACGEVDFLEYYRGALHANSVYQGKNNRIWNKKATKIADLGGCDWDDNFHIYKIRWDKQRIAIYVDNTLLNDIPIDKTINQPLGNNPFQEEFYFLINLALGQGGEKIPSENLPSKFIVDYIRVYK